MGWWEEAIARSTTAIVAEELNAPTHSAAVRDRSFSCSRAVNCPVALAAEHRESINEREIQAHSQEAGKEREPDLVSRSAVCF